MADWLSILPAVVAITIVFWRKEVILALLMAVFTSEVLLILDAGIAAPALGVLQTLEQIASVFEDIGNTRILIFSLLIGALLAYMRLSGGVSALVEKLMNKGVAKSERQVGLLTYFTGIVVFIESNLSVLTAGIVSRGLFDKFKMSRARLAYIVDSTSAPVCILILLNGWGAYVLGLLGTYDLPDNPVSILISTIPFNFYAIFTLVVVFYTVWTGKLFGPLKAADQASFSTESPVELETNIKPTKARFMLIPLLTMVFGMVFFMLWTGDGNLAQGSGSKSVLYSTSIACLVAYLLMIRQPDFNHQKLVKIGFDGMGELLPLVTIVLMSLALGSSLKELGTGIFISGLVADFLPLFVVPAVLFIAGGLISFTTGTSWGTFAILIPIGMPLVINLGLPPSVVLAAILGGGVFGDHCSPISDTTAVSSIASGCDLLEHVRTQLPYALFCGGLTVIAYLVIGFVMI